MLRPQPLLQGSQLALLLCPQSLQLRLKATFQFLLLLLQLLPVCDTESWTTMKSCSLRYNNLNLGNIVTTREVNNSLKPRAFWKQVYMWLFIEVWYGRMIIRAVAFWCWGILLFFVILDIPSLPSVQCSTTPYGSTLSNKLYSSHDWLTPSLLPATHYPSCCCILLTHFIPDSGELQGQLPLLHNGTLILKCTNKQHWKSLSITTELLTNTYHYKHCVELNTTVLMLV